MALLLCVLLPLCAMEDDRQAQAHALRRHSGESDLPAHCTGPLTDTGRHFLVGASVTFLVAAGVLGAFYAHYYPSATYH